ncbi:MAG: hypothetical protein JWP02_2561 [Acidimicrobiales bacterium]|nr:hypothetical protein [Acidimicrobiales bacterium]
MADHLPPLLTVEEAAKVLRIGRTKAYAMANEWRATNGRSGLPVVDFGHVLRVPRCQLEAIVGGPLVDVELPERVDPPPEQPIEAAAMTPVAETRTGQRPTRRTTKRNRATNSAQLTLIELDGNG